MKNYDIYTNEYGDAIVEVFNEGEEEMLRMQQSLTQQGYIISQVCGCFIKCHKVGEGEER